MGTIYTIGHSNHSLEKLVSLLRAVGATTVVDVRSAPYSKYCPHFNRESLAPALVQAGLDYAYAGKQLGGRPLDPDCYKGGTLPVEGTDYLHEVDYPAVMQRAWFQAGIARLLEIAATQQVAVLCSEEDPALCHRHHLIARYLLAANPQVAVRHVRGDGSVFPAHTLHASVDAPAVVQHTLF
jgi:uncharacterized protein (DUF488 family)